jgi:hypothetical protein
LINKGTAQSRIEVGHNEKQPTSIRLKPETRHFLECQASALNTSVQGLINTILDGVVEASLDKTSATLRTMRERFFLLFEAHQLNLPDIVGILRTHDFTLSALENHARFYDLLDQRTLDYLAGIFSVQKQWLTGASAVATPSGSEYRWYKNFPAIARKLRKHKADGLQPRIMFVRRGSANFAQARELGDATNREPIGVVVQLRRKIDDGRYFDTAEVYEFERWNYWRCREQIKLLICFCEETGLSFDGYECPESVIRELENGTVLPITTLRSASVSWTPEDYATLHGKVAKEAEEWSSVKEQYTREIPFTNLPKDNVSPLNEAGSLQLKPARST